MLLLRYIVLDNGLKALLISDYSGPAASEDEDLDGEDEGEEEDDASSDDTEAESEDEDDEEDEDDDNEAKKKKGNAEKQVFLNVKPGFGVCQGRAGESSHVNKLLATVMKSDADFTYTHQPILHVSCSAKYVNLAANILVNFICSCILVINLVAAASG